MNHSPSRYGGIAAVLLLGIGLLASGKIGLGLEELALGAIAFAVALSPTRAARRFFVAIGIVIFSGFFAYQAASNEITGMAIYHPKIFPRDRPGERVARETSPAKFREATNILWGFSLLGVLAGVVFLSLSRRLNEVGDET